MSAFSVVSPLLVGQVRSSRCENSVFFFFSIREMCLSLDPSGFFLQVNWGIWVIYDGYVKHLSRVLWLIRSGLFGEHPWTWMWRYSLFWGSCQHLAISNIPKLTSLVRSFPFPSCPMYILYCGCISLPVNSRM